MIKILNLNNRTQIRTVAPLSSPSWLSFPSDAVNAGEEIMHIYARRSIVSIVRYDFTEVFPLLSQPLKTEHFWFA